MNASQESFGAANWASRVRVTATGDTTLKTVKAASGKDVQSGSDLTNRLVLTGYKISGLNTNAAQTTIEIRNATTTAAVLLGATMAITTGSIALTDSNCWLPLIANENLQLSVGGALTGHVDVTVWGRMLPASTHVADKYDMTA